MDENTKGSLQKPLTEGQMQSCFFHKGHCCRIESNYKNIKYVYSVVCIVNMNHNNCTTQKPFDNRSYLNVHRLKTSKVELTSWMMKDFSRPKSSFRLVCGCNYSVWQSRWYNWQEKAFPFISFSDSHRSEIYILIWWGFWEDTRRPREKLKIGVSCLL